MFLKIWSDLLVVEDLMLELKLDEVNRWSETQSRRDSRKADDGEGTVDLIIHLAVVVIKTVSDRLYLT